MLAALSQGVSLKFTAFLAAYVIALGAVLLARTPASAGAFDPTLIAIHDRHEQLVVLLIVFCCIYDLIPPCMAFLAIVAQPRSRTPRVVLHKERLPVQLARFHESMNKAGWPKICYFQRGVSFLMRCQINICVCWVSTSRCWVLVAPLPATRTGICI